MEIIKIGSDSVKISLCGEEAGEYDLNYDDAELLKNGFINLLLKLRESFSFAVIGEKITAEMFTGKDGGCEIFISRVEVCDKVYKEKVIEDTSKKPKHIAAVYIFDSFNKVLEVASRLDRMEFLAESSLYYDDEKENYYFMFEELNSKDLKYAFIHEYGKYIKSSLYPVIKEHHRCIFKRNAIKKLSQLY